MKTPVTSEERAQAVAWAANEGRALDIAIIQVGVLMPFCEYFVICHGRSPLHNEAICDRVEELLREVGMRPHHREGQPRGDWTILDYGDVLLHVFSETARRFYDLERLWAEAPRLEVNLPVGTPGEAG
jgi:ribosome-associated protein